MTSSYNHVIILEGPDGAGKTTLAERLREANPWGGATPQIIHEGPPPAGVDLLTYYTELLLAYLAADAPVILDRFHMGETVYGPTCRGGTTLTDRGRVLLDRVCRAAGVLTVLCLPSLATCTLNWRAKPAKDYLRQDAAKLWEVYHRFLALAPQYALYDYESKAELKELLTQLREAPRALPAGCAGAPGAAFLVIGEKSNGPFDLPFHALNNSSEYLNGALAEAGYAEAQLALVNALKLDGRVRYLKPVLDALPALRVVVALGKVAQRQAELACAKRPDLALVYLNHPQHQKRFYAADRADYVTQLQEAMNGAL